MGLTRKEWAGLWIAHHYPEQWRRRHGADLDHYLEVRGARTGDLVGLGVGLVDAHLQVLRWRDWWPAMNRHVTRGLVLSAAAVVLLLVGSGALVKASEDGSVGILTHHDVRAWTGLATVVGSAWLGLVVVVVGSASAVVRVGRRLAADRDAAGLAAFLAPAVICVVLFAELLVAAEYADGGQALAVTLLAASGVLGVGVSLWCLAVALSRAAVDTVPIRPARPAATVLAVLGILALLGEALWASRVATLPARSHLTGIVSLPLPLTVLAIAACSLMAVGLAVLARREIALGVAA